MNCGGRSHPDHSARPLADRHGPASGLRLLDAAGSSRVALAYVVAPRSEREDSHASVAPRPAFVLVDEGGRAVACFRGRPFIAHPDLEALLAMHGLTRRDLVRPTSVGNDAIAG
jgi:hypothetical protein